MKNISVGKALHSVNGEGHPPWITVGETAESVFQPLWDCGITFVAFPENVFFRVLKRRPRAMLSLTFRRRNVAGHMDQSVTLAELLRGSCKIVSPMCMCFVELEKT